jgi:beta-lactamase superfamily II metal-dependent hydrolase
VHELIPQFAKSPEQKAESSVSFTAAMNSITEMARKAMEWIAEYWHIESLREDVKTSAENESSVVIYGSIDGRGILLTGDVGVRGLHAAADYSDAQGVSIPSSLKFSQIPHHGSRNNVSTTALDRILGARKASNDGIQTLSACVSVSKESKTHPRKAVTNAFIRRGCQIAETRGTTICNWHNMDARGWGAASTIPFSNEVEAWD